MTAAEPLPDGILHVIGVPTAMAGADHGLRGLASRHREALAAADRIGVYGVVAFPLLGCCLSVGEAARIVVSTLTATPTSVELVCLGGPRRRGVPNTHTARNYWGFSRLTGGASTA